MSTPNIGSGKTPELTQQRIDQAVERNKKYDGVEVEGWTESETKTFKLVNDVGGQSTPNKDNPEVDRKYTFYTRTDTTGGDSGTIQVWSKDDKGETQHMGSYYKDEGYQKFHKNNNILNGPKSDDPRVQALKNKSNTLLVQENARQTLKTASLDSCIAKKGEGSREACNAQAEGYANDILLNEEANKALQEAEKTQPDTDEETLQKQQEAMSDDIDNAHQRTEYEDIVYPIDLNPEYQDFIQFQMIEYQPRKFKSAAKAGALGSRMTPGIQTVKVKGGTGNAIRGISGVNTNDYGKQKNGERKILATMTLPIPSGIADQNSVNWGEKSLSQLDQQLASSAGEITSGTGTGAGDISNKAQIGATGTAVQVGLINAALSGADFAQRQYGATLNKNMELLFNGPKLRGFNFTFRLSPRSADEAAAVKAMIRQFKQGMSPKKGKTFTFIKAPHTFFIGYYHKGSTSPWLNMFKECALESMSMSYTPDGQYSTFHDGALTSYQMQLSFKELEPVFDSDYDDLSKGQGASGIGANEYIGY